MGLHLDFELHLPGSVSRPEIVDTLGQLRAHTMRTPVGEVTELITIDKRHGHPDRGQTQPPLGQTNSRFV